MSRVGSEPTPRHAAAAPLPSTTPPHLHSTAFAPHLHTTHCPLRHTSTPPTALCATPPHHSLPLHHTSTPLPLRHTSTPLPLHHTSSPLPLHHFSTPRSAERSPSSARQWIQLWRLFSPAVDSAPLGRRNRRPVRVPLAASVGIPPAAGAFSRPSPPRDTRREGYLQGGAAIGRVRHRQLEGAADETREANRRLHG